MRKHLNDDGCMIVQHRIIQFTNSFFSTQKDKTYLSLSGASEKHFLRLGGLEFVPQGFTFWICGGMM